MDDPPATVFLSGTRRDLQAFYPPAKAAIERLHGYRAVLMEDSEAEDIPPDHWSRREATKPDLLVGLIGRYYGATLHGGMVSLTEQEYDVAKQLSIHRLMFLSDAGDPSPANTQSHEARDRIERFRERISSDVVWREARSPSDFARRAISAIRAWERRTLGGATLTPDEYFRHWLEAEREYGHQAQLVGQHATLERLGAFASSSRRVFVLHAPAGRGKSRVILEWARSQAGRVRVIRDRGDLSRRRLDVSAVDPCILVLEDEQKRSTEELETLLSFLRRCGPEVKLVASTRGIALLQLGAALRGAGFRQGEVEEWQLPELSDEDHRRLVREILGHDDRLTHLVAARTQGNPLAAVVAARLCLRTRLTLADVESSPDFEWEVLRRFKDALLQETESDPAGRTRLDAVLQAVAAVAPIRPSDEAQMVALAMFLSVPVHEFHRDLNRLEDAGLLYRRGGLLGIPVDAVGEAVLLEACVTPRGDATGFAGQALDTLWPVLGSNLLRNLAAADWTSSRGGRGAQLLESFWPQLNALYEDLPASGRIPLLEGLATVAPYQPELTLDFCRRAFPSGLGPPEPIEAHRGFFRIESIHDGLTAVLKSSVRVPALVREACNMLLEVAEQDVEDAQRYLEGAERVLQEVGTPMPSKQIACVGEFLAWAEAGARATPARAARIAKYVGAVLAKEVMDPWWDGLAIHFEAHAVPPAAFNELRLRSLKLLEEIAVDGNIAAAASAIGELREALGPVVGMLGRTVTDVERAQWEPEQEDILRRLTIIHERRGGAVIRLCIRAAIHWTAANSESNAVRERARALERDLDESLQDSLEYALVHPFQVHAPESWDQAGHQRQELALARAKVLMNTGHAVGELLAPVRQAVMDLESAALQVDAGMLLHALAEADPVRASNTAIAIATEQGHPLARWLPGLIGGVIERDVERARALVDQLLNLPGTEGAQAVAACFRTDDWVSRLGDGVATARAEKLLARPEGIVRSQCLSSLALSRAIASEERCRLLAAYDLERAPETAEGWAFALTRKDAEDHLTLDECVEIAGQLVYALALDHFGMELVDQLAVRAPDAIADMLLQRVRGLPVGHDPLKRFPRNGGERMVRRLPAVTKRRLLRELGSLLDSDDFRVTMAARQIFAALGGTDPEIHRDTLREWVREGTAASLERAGQSLRDEEPEVLFWERELICELIHAAAARGRECLRNVRSELHAVAHGGIRTGTPGEPMQRDVSIRDQAREIAAGLPAGSPESDFYQSVAMGMEDRIQRDRARFEEERM